MTGPLSRLHVERYKPARPRRSSTRLVVLIVVTASVLLTTVRLASAQSQGNYAIWGEVRITSAQGDKNVPSGVTIILYRAGGGESGRQTISSGGTYRFTNLNAADYDIVAEIEDREIARVRLSILPGALSPFYGFRQDLDFDWKSNSTGSKPAVISAADAYTRSANNQSLFRKAQEAAEKKNYQKAIEFLQQILAADNNDFQVWTLLGTVYLVQENSIEAEKAYLKSIELKPTFALALLNLGRLRLTQKRYDEATDPLTRAVESQPESSEANFLLGEVYIQLKKGSKAIPYLNEAARLGRPEAHLQLAWLYDAAGMKDKAAAEYTEFLKKKPDYPDRKKFEEYIRTNKKPAAKL